MAASIRTDGAQLLAEEEAAAGCIQAWEGPQPAVVLAAVAPAARAAVAPDKAAKLAVAWLGGQAVGRQRAA